MSTTEETRACVYKYILGLRCPSKYNGFRYLRDGVSIVIKNQDGIECLNKNVYLAVAEKYHTGVCNVERSMRTLVDKWWVSAQCGGLFDKKPTNAELFHTLAAKIFLELGLGWMGGDNIAADVT